MAAKKRTGTKAVLATRKVVAMKPVVKGPVDGNAFAVMGAVIKALKRAGQGEVVAEYVERATAGDYSNLLRVSMEYVEFEDLD